MARVVVLSFQDNEAADQFVLGLLKAQGEELVSTADVGTLGAIALACSKIEAIVARPTAYCKCTIVGKSGRANASRGKFSALTEQWGRTERFGWYVHRRCNRVNFFVWRDFIKNMLISSGHNLLSELEERLHANTPTASTDGDGSVRAESEAVVPAGPDGEVLPTEAVGGADS